MCFALLEGAGDCAKAIAGAICCCLCAGPVLIIVGLVLLVGENTREEDVQSYNNALTSYETDTAPILRDLTVTVEGTTMGRSSERVPVEGSMDEVNEGTHLVFRAGNVAYATNDNYQFNFARGAAAATQSLPASSSVTQNIPRSASVTRDIRCTQATCDRFCSSNDYECSASSSSSYCSSQFGGSYTHTRSGDCEEGETCGRCTYTGELSKACTVVAVSSSSIADSSRYASCYYPFSLSGNDYAVSSGSARTSATMEVMSADDPFIALQRITEGSNNFGISEAAQRVTGAVLLVFGLLITCGMIGAAVFFYRHHEKKKQQRMDGGYPPNQGNGGMYNGPAQNQQQPQQYHNTQHQQVQQPAQYDNHQDNGYQQQQQQQQQYGNNQNNGYNGGQPNYPQPQQQQQQGYNGGGYDGGNKVQPV